MIKLLDLLKEIKLEEKIDINYNLPIVKNIFKQFPELNTIGTPEQYVQYLDKVFPNSKIKDIVYHGSKTKKPTEIFVDTHIGKNHKKLRCGPGFYFTKDIKYSKLYGDTTFSIINIQRPTDFNSADYDEIEDIVNAALELRKTGDGIIDSSENYYYPADEEGLKLSISPDYIVFKPEQIRVLGSQEDIEGFKNFVNSK